MDMQLLADPITLIFGGLGIGLGLLILLLFLVATAFWIWMLVDAISNESLDGTERLIWAVAIFFSHIIGSVLYYALVRSKRASLPPGIPR